MGGEGHSNSTPSPALFGVESPALLFVPPILALVGLDGGLALAYYLCPAAGLLIFSMWQCTWLCRLEAQILLTCLAALRLLLRSLVKLNDTRMLFDGKTC